MLTAEEPARAINLDVVILIGAAFGLGAALTNSGLADALAGVVVAATVALGPARVLFGVVVVTSLLTEIISNNAVVVVFPVAMATAAATGLDPRPFAVAVAIAGSSSFLRPVGYQTNWWRDEREQASLVISCAAFHRKGSLLRAESIVGMAREA